MMGLSNEIAVVGIVTSCKSAVGQFLADLAADWFTRVYDVTNEYFFFGMT